jgi:hypothetical protein
VTKKRDPRAHKHKRQRSFYHNAQPAALRLLGRRWHQTGWLKEYRARRTAWAQEARERAEREERERTEREGA